MTFWQDSSLEPKRTYKFILSIPGTSAGTKISRFLVKKVAKPSWETTSVEHKFLNHTFYYPGKTTWQPIEVTVVDTIDPTANATQQIMKVLEASGYELPQVPKVVAGWGTVSKAKAVDDGLGSVTIDTIDAGGAIVETWVLNNAWIQKASFGDLSYEDEALLDVTFTIQYDNAYVNVKTGDGKIPTTSG